MSKFAAMQARQGVFTCDKLSAPDLEPSTRRACRARVLPLSRVARARFNILRSLHYSKVHFAGGGSCQICHQLTLTVAFGMIGA